MRIVKQTLAAHNRVSDGQLVSALLALGCAGATWLISPSMPLWQLSQLRAVLCLAGHHRPHHRDFGAGHRAQHAQVHCI